ncbi:hypothetical protein MiTa_04666 [Microcystis aeruginosa NIES-4264]|nr:hypothetical protein MiTa_04666 [Microcystis aeruginosa NIES-4264]
MEVLWLKSQKIPHKKICQLAGISPNTLLTYLRDYEEGGIEKSKEINFYRPKSELESQKETLKKWLFVTCYGSIGGHKSTKSLSGKRFN